MYKASNDLALNYASVPSLLSYRVMRIALIEILWTENAFDSPSEDTIDKRVRAIYTVHNASAAGMHLWRLRHQLQQSNAPSIHAALRYRRRLFIHQTSTVSEGDWRLSTHTDPTPRRFVRFWAFGGAMFPEMGDSLPRTSLNHRVKFDAASFILGGEIRNRINIHTNKQNYSKRYCLHLAYRHVWITSS